MCAGISGKAAVAAAYCLSIRGQITARWPGATAAVYNLAERAWCPNRPPTHASSSTRSSGVQQRARKRASRALCNTAPKKFDTRATEAAVLQQQQWQCARRSLSRHCYRGPAIKAFPASRPASLIGNCSCRCSAIRALPRGNQLVIRVVAEVAH